MDNFIKNVIGGGLHNYSTQEHIVGKWIDGSDIYEKSLVTTLSSNTKDEELLNVDNLKFVISFNATIKRSTGYGTMLNYYVSSSNNDNFYWYKNGIFVNSAAGGTLYCTCTYIKNWYLPYYLYF